MTPVQDEVLNQLLGDLASIPVPPSFKTFSHVDPITFYTEMLSFVGFTPETAQAIAIQVESNGSSSLTTTALEWLQTHSEGCSADLVGASYDALEKADVYSSSTNPSELIKEFASDCARFVIGDPLRNIMDIVAESIDDAVTLRDYHAKVSVSHGKGKKENPPKSNKDDTTKPPFDKSVTQKLVQGKFIPITALDSDTPLIDYPRGTAWKGDEEYVTGYRSFSHEAANKYVE